MSMVDLKQGDKRDAVRFLQRDLNERSQHRGMPYVAVDGDLGPQTMQAVQRVARSLGATEADLKVARDTKTISVDLQRMIRWPENRSEVELQRARDRDQAKPATSGHGPMLALTEARRWVGTTERQNFQRVIGWIHGTLGVRYRVPWCGCFAHHCLKTAGVQNLTYRMAAVRYILEDGASSRNGMERIVYRRATGHGKVASGRRGDLIGLYGESTHVGLVDKRGIGGYWTVEGNTSSASQANGGSVQRKFRPDSAVVYLVRPRWPS